MWKCSETDSESKQAPKVVKLFDKESKPVTKQTAPKPPAPPPPTPTPQTKSPQQKKPEVQKSTPPPAKKSRIQATIIPGMLKDDFKVSFLFCTFETSVQEEYAVKAGDDEESEKKSQSNAKTTPKAPPKRWKTLTPLMKSQPSTQLGCLPQVSGTCHCFSVKTYFKLNLFWLRSISVNFILFRSKWRQYDRFEQEAWLLEKFYCPTIKQESSENLKNHYLSQWSRSALESGWAHVWPHFALAGGWCLRGLK